ncbi:MAG: PadR family transcriptional regulator [Cyanobacteria bacterium REEB67]|nr:PadR family transcriptional regulator [Cyanobacteria bacterium REEB67]
MLHHENFCHPFFHMMGPRRGGGGRGFGPFGGGFFGGFGGGGGPNFGAGRKLNAENLQLLILSLLEQKPRHGYQLIKELEERSGGFYTPSPGVIYPALTYLSDIGFASVETSGSKKLYNITEEGRQHLEANRQMVEVMLGEMAYIGNKMERMQNFFANEEGREGGESGAGVEESMFIRGSAEFRDAMSSLRAAIRQNHHCSPKEAQRIAAIISKATAEILGKS